MAITVPYEGLSEEVNKIHDVKIAYFERFWEPSGKVAVRTLAAAATGVSFLSEGSEFFSLFLAFLWENFVICVGIKS